MADNPRIVLTGGPCGGKTTLLSELRAADPRGERWLPVPEVAPLLFQAGLDGRWQSFQQAVVKLQIALEESCAAAAHPQQVLLCHRGTLDALAYWLRNGWDEGEFFMATGMSREEHYRRYLGVIHLQTVAIGAEGCYRRWPDAHRPETIEQAAEIDRLCARTWGGHPRYVLADNVGKDWLTKSRSAFGVLICWLAQEASETTDKEEHMLWWTLRQLKSKDPKIRFQAAEKLGEAKKTRAVEPLIAALKDSDASVQRAAIKALEQIGDARAMEPLVAALKDSGSFERERAARALRSLGWAPQNDTQRALVAVADGDWEKAEKLGAAAVEPLVIAMKDRDWHERARACEVLGKIGGARSVELLIAVLEDSNSKIGKDAEKATEVLISIGGAAVESLVAALKGFNPYMRWWAAGALGKIGDARAVDPLIAVLKGKYYHYSMRDNAAQALVEIGDARAAEPLLAALEGGDVDSYLVVREAVAKILGARTIKLLVRMANSNELNSQQAINSLQRVLEKYASNASQDDLYAVAFLSDVTYKYGQSSCDYVRVKLDCSIVRQLARHELIRRGLEA